MTQAQFIETVIAAMMRMCVVPSHKAQVPQQVAAVPRQPSPPPPQPAQAYTSGENKQLDLEAFMQAARAYANGEPTPPGFYVADSTAESAPEQLPWVSPT